MMRVILKNAIPGHTSQLYWFWSITQCLPDLRHLAEGIDVFIEQIGWLNLSGRRGHTQSLAIFALYYCTILLHKLEELQIIYSSTSALRLKRLG